jgi:hypothetical protein
MATLSDKLDKYANTKSEQHPPTLAEMISGYEDTGNAYLMALTTSGLFSFEHLAFWFPLLPKIVQEKQRREREEAGASGSSSGSTHRRTGGNIAGLEKSEYAGRFQGNRGVSQGVNKKSVGISERANIATIADYETDIKASRQLATPLRSACFLPCFQLTSFVMRLCRLFRRTGCHVGSPTSSQKRKRTEHGPCCSCCKTWGTLRRNWTELICC